MTLRALAGTAVAGLAVAGLAGCGTIYSTQNYGSPQSQRVTAGATKSDVFANLGEPNSLYRADGGEVFVYKHATGSNILGLYSKVKRTDYVVIFDAKQNVLYAGDVPVGKGWTILSPPMMDATHPVRTDDLLFDPENYSYEAGE